MGDYNRNNRSRGGSRGGGDFRGRDTGPREMHKAVCDECGQDCQVPFRPSGGKPIYCSDCFEKRDNGGSRNSGRRNFDRRGPGGSSQGSADDSGKKILSSLNSLNEKLDRILKVMESNSKSKPVSKKPVTPVIEKKTKKEVEPKKAKKVSKKAKKTTKESK